MRSASVDRYRPTSASFISNGGHRLSTVVESEKPESGERSSAGLNSPRQPKTVRIQQSPSSASTPLTRKKTRAATSPNDPGSPRQDYSRPAGTAAAAAQVAISPREVASPPPQQDGALAQRETSKAVPDITSDESNTDKLHRQPSTRTGRRPPTLMRVDEANAYNEPPDHRGAKVSHDSGIEPPLVQEQPGNATIRGSFIPSTPTAMSPSIERVPVTNGESGESASRPTSPGRSAHFPNHLSVTDADQVLHNPPPRSLSPSKSALKHSAIGPEGRPIRASSEVSDGASFTSDEGSRAGSRRRHPKVSFDDEAEVVGIAATPPTSPEDTIPHPASSAQKKRSKTPWISLGKKKNAPIGSSSLDEDDEFDRILKPRPALPSFGSVREDTSMDQQRRSGEYSGENKSISLSDSSSIVANSSTGDTHGTAKSIEKNGNGNGALPNGYSNSGDEALKGPAHAASAGTGTSAAMADISQPRIAVSDYGNGSSHERGVGQVSGDANSEDAIPLGQSGRAVKQVHEPQENQGEKLDGSDEEDFDETLYKMPGDFPSSYSDEEPMIPGPKTERPQSYAKEFEEVSPFSTEEEAPSDSSEESGPSGTVPDIESNGFGSINAIVDSKDKSLYPAPSQQSGNESEHIAPEAKEKAGQEVTPLGNLPVVETPRSPAFLSDSPAGKASEPIHSSDAPFQLDHEGEADNFLQKSENGKGKAPMYVEVNGKSKEHDSPNVNRSISDAKSYPRRTPPQKSKQAAPGLYQESIISNGVGCMQTKDAHSSSTTTHPGPYRGLSNGSDSSSSFKRTHARPAAKHDFKRTMRTNGTGPNTIKLPDTVRPNTKATQKSVKPSGLHFTSRFSDSDDEEGSNMSYARNFHSRFDDSSDDEENPTVIGNGSVRGIPRVQGMHDGDSTELEDSSDDDEAEGPEPGMMSSEASALAAVAKARGMTPSQLDDFLHRPVERRKTSGGGGGNGFFGRLHRGNSKKKQDDEERKRSVSGTSTFSETDGGRRLSFSRRLHKKSVGGNKPSVSVPSTPNNERPEWSRSANYDNGIIQREKERKDAEAQRGGGYNGALRDVVVSSTMSTEAPRKKGFSLRRMFGLRS